MRRLLGAGATLAALIFAAPASAQFMAKAPELAGPCMTTAPTSGLSDPPADCARAIAEAPDKRRKAVLIFAWGYSLSDAGNTLGALPWLDQAIELAPDFGNARQERGYVLNALGEYQRAISDLDLAIKMLPDVPNFYQERAYARHGLAQFGLELADRDKVIEIAGPSPDHSVGRAEALMWLARYAEAEKELTQWRSGMLGGYGQKMLNEIRHRRAYKPMGDAAKQCTLQSVDDKEAATGLHDACTWAFDHEKNPAKRADFMTVRGSAIQIAEGSAEAGVADFGMAAALDPKNARHHANFGSLLVSIHHSWAARNAFNRALALPGANKQIRALALGGRAQANYNLGDKDAAKADAQAAMALEPLPPAMDVLARLAFDQGDKATAKRLWLQMWRTGMRDSDLRDNLRSVGVLDPDKAAAE
jgi:tetratricopeptide (TPR) repeat protein